MLRAGQLHHDLAETRRHDHGLAQHGLLQLAGRPSQGVLGVLGVLGVRRIVLAGGSAGGGAKSESTRPNPVVGGVGDQDVAAGGDAEGMRLVEIGGGRGAAVAGESVLPGPGKADDHAVRADVAHLVAVVVGDQEAAVRQHLDVGGRVQQGVGGGTAVTGRPALGGVADDGRDRAVRRHAAHDVMLVVGDQEAAVGGGSDVVRVAEARGRGRATVAVGAVAAVAGDRRDRAVRRDAANDAVAGVGDQEATVRGRDRCSRIVELRERGVPAIAGVTGCCRCRRPSRSFRAASRGGCGWLLVSAMRNPPSRRAATPSGLAIFAAVAAIPSPL